MDFVLFWLETRFVKSATGTIAIFLYTEWRINFTIQFYLYINICESVKLTWHSIKKIMTVPVGLFIVTFPYKNKKKFILKNEN